MSELNSQQADPRDEEIAELRRELFAERKCLSELAEAGTGYSQQTVDALTRERDRLQQEVTRLTWMLKAIELSGTPGVTIAAHRDDGHSCGWCRGMVRPCPVEIARKALEQVESWRAGQYDVGRHQ